MSHGKISGTAQYQDLREDKEGAIWKGSVFLVFMTRHSCGTQELGTPNH